MRDGKGKEPNNRTGVLLLRVWTEERGTRFRARISSLGDESSEQAMAVAADPGHVVDMVRDWLGQFVRPDCPPS
jgi:hypothetical protein